MGDSFPIEEMLLHFGIGIFAIGLIITVINLYVAGNPGNILVNLISTTIIRTGLTSAALGTIGYLCGMRLMMVVTPLCIFVLLWTELELWSRGLPIARGRYNKEDLRRKKNNSDY